MKLDETPGYALCRIARKVHYQSDLIFKEEGMTVEQLVALKTISENQPLIQKELGRLIEKTPNTVKSLAERLEKKNFIKRTPDPSDHRNLILTVTEKGQKFTEEYSALDEKANDALTSSLTKEEMEELARLLDKIEKNL